MLGIDGNTLLFFGLVREYKGLKYLLSAMPKVIECRKAHLLVVTLLLLEQWAGMEARFDGGEQVLWIAWEEERIVLPLPEDR
jgi:hypothetical protein